MKNPNPHLAAACFVFGVISLAPGQSAAAVLSGTVDTNPGNVLNLTTAGPDNWSIWHYTLAAVTPASTLVPSNRMSGAPGAGIPGYISDAFRVGGTAGATIRGGNGQTLDPTYINGVSPISADITNIRMVFPSDLNSPGNGVGVSITGNPAQLYRISVWASGLDGQGTMTASSSGVDDVELFSQSYGASGGDGQKVPTLFTFLFQPDNLADVLTLQYVLSTNDGGSSTSHVGISAVTVEAIPEPGFATLTGLGCLALLRRRHP